MGLEGFMDYQKTTDSRISINPWIFIARKHKMWQKIKAMDVTSLSDSADSVKGRCCFIQHAVRQT